MENTRLSKNNSGLVSISVTLIIMIITVLISVSIVEISNRELKQSLDRQLSTQAYYAAESGVNDAIAAIKAGTASGGNNNCNDFNPSNRTLNSLGDVKYTCLLMNSSSGSNQKNVDTNSSWITKVEHNTAGTIINNINLNWINSAYTNNRGTLQPKLLPGTTWNLANNVPMLRITAIPVPNPSSISRANIDSNSKTFFLYPRPSTTAGTLDYITTSNASIVGSPCDSSGQCNMRLTNLGSLASPLYYLRITPIYSSALVTITGVNSLASNLKSTQIVIDSTGKANDVLKRIQVRVPIDEATSGTAPEFVVQSMENICKRQVIISDTEYDNSFCNSH